MLSTGPYTQGKFPHVLLERTGKPGNWKYLAGLGLAVDFISLNFDESQSFMISESISDKSWHSKS